RILAREVVAEDRLHGASRRLARGLELDRPAVRLVGALAVAEALAGERERRVPRGGLRALERPLEEPARPRGVAEPHVDASEERVEVVRPALVEAPSESQDPGDALEGRHALHLGGEARPPEPLDDL